MTSDPLVIIGGGGHAGVVADAAISSGVEICGYVARENTDQTLLGAYLGDDDHFESSDFSSNPCICGIGIINRKTAVFRRSILDRLDDMTYTNIIHPRAILLGDVELAQGVFVAAGSIVGKSVTLARHAIVNTGAIIDHDCKIGSNTHIATGARLAGNVTVGNDCLIGIGAIVVQGTNIGDGTIIGAGALVRKDVEANSVVYGVEPHKRDASI